MTAKGWLKEFNPYFLSFSVFPYFFRLSVLFPHFFCSSLLFSSLIRLFLSFHTFWFFSVFSSLSHPLGLSVEYAQTSRGCSGRKDGKSMEGLKDEKRRKIRISILEPPLGQIHKNKFYSFHQCYLLKVIFYNDFQKVSKFFFREKSSRSYWLHIAYIQTRSLFF